MTDNPVLTPFASPLYVMPKPAGAACNMACKYCYYLEKKKYYPTDAPRKVMSDETLEEFIRQYIGATITPEVNFTWHGGEAMMRPIEFYRKALELQRRYGAGRNIVNCFQTNGTLLTPEWARFFKENDFLVGVSIDGPREIHDEFRRLKGGGPSWRKVMAAIDMLKDEGVEWNAMAVVNDYVADYPDQWYSFFKEIDCQFIQFAPIVERISEADRGLCSVDMKGCLTDFSVSPSQWGVFLCRLFDLWVGHDVGRTFIQIFDATLANWVGVLPGVCSLAPRCGHAAALEWNGDLYSCDHFVFPQYRLGNIRSSSIAAMMTSDRQRAFGEAKRSSLPSQCLQCRWLKACNGECPKNRFAVTATGEPGLNFLCEGYRAFFSHVAPYMDWMKEALERKEAPAGIMDTPLAAQARARAALPFMPV
ncbi:MAG: anaerobic sulfatase-maturation protein [Pseudoflavonifractor sp.]|nr:anaerobic sulfatase-maturation protein [Alloprevotella sp.]MCM1116200.1 anaerobic sulfatase-maturation protein [Pseudoflavonifractor sp.]